MLRYKLAEGEKNRKSMAYAVDELKSPKVRSFGFIKFVDNSSSLVIVGVIMWVSPGATPGWRVKSRGM
jgi:hypothetical protein